MLVVVNNVAAEVLEVEDKLEVLVVPVLEVEVLITKLDDVLATAVLEVDD